MKRQVNLYEAKTQLSQLVEDAAKGDVIIIAKNGKPMAKLSLIEPASDGKPKKRELGQWAKLMTPEESAYRDSPQFWRDWKQWDAEIERDFEESINRPIDQPIELFHEPSPMAEPTREFKWADTSSTPMRSSGRKTGLKNSARKSARSSKTRKTRSS